MSHNFTNRLINEKSPYLLQHAHNPVDWYPWSEEALKKAKDENKPIFLSVGYSTCHWCHVMEHESFENENIAEIMNKYFVNIKVDREENPGVDKLYMTYIQLTTGSGGWPMSVFLTPDLNPFFGSSYFPPEDQNGRPGFKTLLNRIALLWISDSNKVKASGHNMIQQMKTYIDAKPAQDSKQIDTNQVAMNTYDHFVSSFDSEHGGFGTAPKFPTPVQLQFLIDFYMYNHQNAERAKEARNALDMTLLTLRKIAAGGIHDHVGGGFHRYSTDTKWHVPHFEKMLYDQAQLLSVYSSAYQITGETLFLDIVNDIVKYVSRDLYHTEGGFYSAEDADSLPFEGAPKKLEGAFCVWENSELQDILGLVNSYVFGLHYSVKEDGNVDSEQDPHKELLKKNVLMESGTIKNTAKAASMTFGEVKTVLDIGKEKLWEYRSKVRPHPHRDEKIITSWNGLMITGLARAYEATQDSNILNLAISTAEFIYSNLYNPSSNTLLRSYCDGPSEIDGFLDDYSYTIQGLLNLYQATFDERWMEWAYNLQEKQNELFYDEENGGYFVVSKADENMLIRMKEEQDGAEPSANAVSLDNLVRLGTILDSSTYRTQSQSTLESFKLALNKFPFAMPALVSSFMLLFVGLKEIVLTGILDDPKMSEFKKIVSRVFLPNKLVAFAKADGFIVQKNQVVKQIAETSKAGVNELMAYICENFACGLPIYETEQLSKRLNQ